MLVEGPLIGFMRALPATAGAPRAEDGAQVHGDTKLELAWTAAPVSSWSAIGAFVFYKLPGIEDVPERERRRTGGSTSPVKGCRFYWQFAYPNGVIAVDRLRAPVGQHRPAAT